MGNENNGMLLVEASVEDLIEELHRRHDAVLVVVTRLHPTQSDTQQSQTIYRGGYMNAVGLARWGLHDLLTTDDET